MTTEDQQAAIRTLKRFFFAVSVSDGPAAWNELGEQARAFVLNLALQQGMDFELGSRLRNGTATAPEREEYLANLVAGLGRDLDGITLSNLRYEADDAEAFGIRVRYLVPIALSAPIGWRGRSPADDDESGSAPPRPSSPAIPAGSALLSQEVGVWRIDRLIPRPGS